MRIVQAMVFWAVALFVCSGCQRSGSSAGSGVDLSPPATWRRVQASTWMVPGVPLAAWSGPDGASLVLYRTLPVPGGSAASLAEALANRLENLPELELRVKRTELIAGETASRVEVVAPGTGDSLAPSGTGKPTAPADKTLVATRQVTLGFPRQHSTLYLTWHMPAASFERLAPDIRATLQGLRFTASDTTSSYSNDR